MADLSTENIKVLSTEWLCNRLLRPCSSKEERLIREELERRGFLASVENKPIPDWAGENANRGREPQNLFNNYFNNIYKECCSLPISDPTTRFLIGVNLAENDSPSELKINVKRHKIKLNFKN